VGLEIRGARLLSFRPRAPASLDYVVGALELHDALSQRTPSLVRAAPI
jgi:hypothetical protein